MIAVDTDIDIDLADRNKVVSRLPHVAASMQTKSGRVKHQTGVYFQEVALDPLDGLCTLPYKEAADLGYFKIDLLPNTIYDGVRDEMHLIELLGREPPWEAFEMPGVVANLNHVRDHFHIVQSIQPKSIEDLAVCLALIRPGKRHLVGRPRGVIDAEVWAAGADGYAFKRTHAVAYAASIIVQLNLLVEQQSE